MELILLYSSVVVSFFLVSKTSPFRFDFIYTLGLFFSSLLAVLPILVYPSSIKQETAFFIILFHLIIIVSFNFISFVFPCKKNTLKSDERVSTTVVSIASFTLLRLLALAFCVFSIANSIFSGSIPILSNAELIAELREDFDYTAVTGNFFDRVVDLLSHFGILFFILSPLYMKKMLTSWLFPLLVFILVVDHSLSSGARASIVLSLIGFSAVYFSINRVNIRYFAIFFGLGVLFIYSFAVLFYPARNPDFESNPEFYVAQNCVDARLHSLILDSSSEMKSFAMSLCYFTSPPYNLQKFMEKTQWTWDYSYGAYNFGFIFRSEFSEIRKSIADLYSSLGIATNPWSTFARDMFIDFGFFLFIIAIFLGLGFRAMIGVCYKCSDMRLARFGLLSAAGFLAPFMSPLIVRPILYPMILSFLIPLLLVFFPRKGEDAGMNNIS